MDKGYFPLEIPSRRQMVKFLAEARAAAPILLWATCSLTPKDPKGIAELKYILLYCVIFILLYSNIHTYDFDCVEPNKWKELKRKELQHVLQAAIDRPTANDTTPLHVASLTIWHAFTFIAQWETLHEKGIQIVPRYRPLDYHSSFRV